MEGYGCNVASIGQVLDVVFQADEHWSLIRNQLWVGQEHGELAGDGTALQSLPKKKKTGAPDTRKFKNFGCDWEGQKRVNFEIDLKYHCIGEEEYKITVVAHSTVEQVDEQGELIPGTELDVFAFEHIGEDSELWYGWFDFMIGCKCPTPRTAPVAAL